MQERELKTPASTRSIQHSFVDVLCVGDPAIFFSFLFSSVCVVVLTPAAGAPPRYTTEKEEKKEKKKRGVVRLASRINGGKTTHEQHTAVYTVVQYSVVPDI